MRNKILIDKLPEDCYSCPCFQNDIECCCGLDDGTNDYYKFTVDENCPLKTIEENDKEIIEQIREELKKILKIYKLKHSDNLIDIIYKLDNKLIQIENKEQNK